MFRLTSLIQLWASLTQSFRLGARYLVTGSMKSTASDSSSIDIARLRKESLSKDPIEVFTEWFNEALKSDVLEPNAFCLSTCSDNKPSARIVLMKAYDNNGFVWFTNYESRKSVELAANPYAAATFWWGPLERSVRVEGMVEKLSDEESDEYHKVRPRSAQIGAWSSQQSRPISGPSELEQQETASIARFEDSAVINRPPHWGGWRLRPSTIEFWKGREARLHDRIQFTKTDDKAEWSVQRLQP
jgi:pyridoxamine-phosphate oxidase